jgi:hypothetical protein
MEVIRCIAYLTMDCSYNKYEWKQNHGKIYNFVSIYNSEHELMNIHFTQKEKKESKALVSLLPARIETRRRSK